MNPTSCLRTSRYLGYKKDMWDIVRWNCCLINNNISDELPCKIYFLGRSFKKKTTGGYRKGNTVVTLLSHSSLSSFWWCAMMRKNGVSWLGGEKSPTRSPLGREQNSWETPVCRKSCPQKMTVCSSEQALWGRGKPGGLLPVNRNWGCVPCDGQRETLFH